MGVGLIGIRPLAGVTTKAMGYMDVLQLPVVARNGCVATSDGGEAGRLKAIHNGNPTCDLQVATDRAGAILCAVRWYLRYSLSFRDVEELLEERGVKTDHTTVWRWVPCYAPELEQRLRGHLKPTNKSWRVDETYIRVKGRWCYLYRAIDSTGATIDFLLSAFRDADAAKRLFRKALSHPSHPQPRVINTDLAPIYGSVIPDIKKEGTLRRRCRHRPVQYLNNILEQDHRDQTAGECQAGISGVSSGAANHSGL
jgi:transposase-like protein